MNRRENAVSPVVAFLLILVVIVSFLSILQGSYLPRLKEEAEVQHLHAVEEGMVEIGSAIGNLVGAEGRQSRQVPIPLGGGDVLFSPTRSSGTLRIVPDDDPVCTLSVTNETGQTCAFSVNISRITYSPVSGFWVSQGYSWTPGVVSVQKGSRITPLSYVNESRADEQETGFLSMLLRFSPEGAADNLTSIGIGLTSLVPGNNTFVSSNGIGEVLILATEQEMRIRNISSLTVTFRADTQGNALTDRFRGDFEEIAARYGGVTATSGPGLLFSPAVNGEITRQEIAISVR